MHGLTAGRDLVATRITTLCLLCAVIAFVVPGPTAAAETGHFCPGLVNIREYIVPQQGFYYLQYNGYYWSDTYRDRHGDKLTSVPVDTLTAQLEVDYSIWLIIPVFVWGAGGRVLGADYAAYISPLIGGVESGITTSIGEYEQTASQSKAGLGDLLVQPIWLGWRWSRAEAALAYCFYAPIGEYEPGRLDNIGLGYWSHVFKATGAYYAAADRSTVLLMTGVYETNSAIEGVDITPGDRVSLDGGLSQYLSTRFEVGIPAYASWQVSADKGADATDDALDRVYGIGVQAGYWAIRDRLQISARYLTQFGARDRYEGKYAALNFLYVF